MFSRGIAKFVNHWRYFSSFFPKQTEVFVKEKTLNKDKQEVSKKHKKN